MVCRRERAGEAPHTHISIYLLCLRRRRTTFLAQLLPTRLLIGYRSPNRRSHLPSTKDSASGLQSPLPHTISFHCLSLGPLFAAHRLQSPLPHTTSLYHLSLGSLFFVCRTLVLTPHPCTTWSLVRCLSSAESPSTCRTTILPAPWFAAHRLQNPFPQAIFLNRLVLGSPSRKNWKESTRIHTYLQRRRHRKVISSSQLLVNIISNGVAGTRTHLPIHPKPANRLLCPSFDQIPTQPVFTFAAVKRSGGNTCRRHRRGTSSCTCWPMLSPMGYRKQDSSAVPPPSLPISAESFIRPHPYPACFQVRRRKTPGGNQRRRHRKVTSSCSCWPMLSLIGCRNQDSASSPLHSLPIVCGVLPSTLYLHILFFVHRVGDPGLGAASEASQGHPSPSCSWCCC